ncbi:hypothetical protein ES703_19930 [subsurface metagenome]
MKQNLNKNLIALAIVIAGLIIGGAYFFTNQGTIQGLSAQEAADKAINFINQSIEEDVTASLLDVVDEGVVYRIHLKIAETEYNSYITKDGKLLFPNAFNLEEQAEEQPEETSQEESQEQPASLEDFAKCLTDEDMKFYGSKNCGWCNKQKELFGDSMKYINYIECLDEESGEVTAECRTEGIFVPGGLGVPTWQLSDGEKIPGFKTFEKLAELSGCSL